LGSREMARERRSGAVGGCKGDANA
jgi:hypothetical protein